MAHQHVIPIKRIILMMTGSARIERVIEVTDAEEVDMYFQPSGFSRAFQSLDIHDDSGEMVTTCRAKPAASSSNYYLDADMEAALGFSSSSGKRNTFFASALQGSLQEVLDSCITALQGVEVTVTKVDGAEITGKVVGFQEQEERRPTTETKEDMHAVVLISHDTFTIVPVADIEKIKINENDYVEDVNDTLKEIAYPPPKNTNLKKVTIQTKGTGTRSLQASYNVDCSPWRVSYRMRVPSASSSTCPYATDLDYSLRGWAEVDNTMGEDWSEIRLTLVGETHSTSGSGSSVVASKGGTCSISVRMSNGAEDLIVTVKTNDLVIDLKRAIQDAGGVPPPSQLILYSGRALEDFLSITAAGLKDGCAVQLFERKATPAAGKQEEKFQDVVRSDTFRYTLPHTINLTNNNSAHIPIVDAPLTARFVTVFNARSNETYTSAAARSIVLTNSSDSVIQAGPLSLGLDDDNIDFLETRISTLKRQEQQVIHLGAEPGVMCGVDFETEDLGINKVTLGGGEIKFHSVLVRTTDYILRNKTGQAVELFLEHPMGSGWEALALTIPFEQERSRYRFKFDLFDEPVEYSVREKRVASETTFLKNLERDMIDEWKAESMVTDEVYDVLKEIVVLSEKMTELGDAIHVREMEVSELLDTQERYRTNINAIVAGAEADNTAYQTYSKELADTEEKLSVISESIRRLKSEEAITDEKHKKMCANTKLEVVTHYFDDETARLVRASDIEGDSGVVVVA